MRFYKYLKFFRYVLIVLKKINVVANVSQLYIEKDNQIGILSVTLLIHNRVTDKLFRLIGIRRTVETNYPTILQVDLNRQSKKCEYTTAGIDDKSIVVR